MLANRDRQSELVRAGLGAQNTQHTADIEPKANQTKEL